ncbi:MAG: regulatory protein RecX [Bacillota bacterium]
MENNEVDIAIRARECALRFLTRKPRTTADVRRELTRRGFSGEVVDGVIVYLEERQIIDDKEYIRRWIEHRQASRSVGRWRLEQELRVRGLPREMISQEISRWIGPHGDLPAAVHLASLRMGKCGDKPLAEAWPQIARFLYQRGFAPEIIELAWSEIKSRAGSGQET